MIQKIGIAAGAFVGAALGMVIGIVTGEESIFTVLGLFVGMGLSYDIAAHIKKENEAENQKREDVDA